MFGLFSRKAPPRPAGPDYTGVSTLEQVHALIDQGELELVILTPGAFGGEPFGANMIFATRKAADVKAMIDGDTVEPLARKGVFTRYVATPTFIPGSLVPTRLDIEASDPGQYTNTIHIWDPPAG